MKQFSLEADPEFWTQVEPGTEQEEFFALWADVPNTPWKAMLHHHGGYALSSANDLGSTTWLLSDEQLGIAAAVVPVSADGPEVVHDAAHAVDLVNRLMGPGIAEPIVTEAMFGELDGFAVTHIHELPDWLRQEAGESDLQLLQTIFVAADGHGTVYFAAISPQLSNVAGHVLIPIAAALQTAAWHD
ncbi:hypothetical protein [uncultured Agrococcus sp.]|uniref:hypothetical protein n=1 Tax=uncultured Agrococcus sp. TaxID=382258 RepID=UPI0025F462CA|nr:hypothetical protein [uncultured Agrococcus sp.]